MKHEPTYINATKRTNIEKYCYKYGTVSGIAELVWHYHLRDDEAIDLINKALSLELITDWDVEPIKYELGL